VSIDAVCRETGITGEVVEARLAHGMMLVDRDLVRIEHPVGNPKFLYITEDGRNALKSTQKRFAIFLGNNWLLIISTVAAIVAAVTGIITIFKP
jgi:hypothetical protein